MSPATTMASHVDDVSSLLPEADASNAEKIRQETVNVQDTTEQLGKMSVETEIPETNGSSTDAASSTTHSMSIGIKGVPVKSSKDGLLDFSISYAPGLGQKEPHEEENDAVPIPGGDDQLENIEEKPKKKKKSKPKKPAATGFEEYYAEAPITPAQFEEEKEDLYAPDKPFVQRMETAIQRYRARRKFDSYRGNIFTKYLILGGVDAGPKPFGGGVDTSGSADDIARQAATDFIGSDPVKFYDPSKPEHWVIDFEGVVKGFLSRKVVEFDDLDKQTAIDTCCNVVRNFLNYLLFHGVCPEYTQEIMSARIICDKAKKELWAIRHLNYFLPGSFNMACSTLYGGHFKDKWLPVGNLWRASDAMIAEMGQKIVGMEDQEAQCVVKTAISVMDNEKMPKAAAAETLHVVKVEELALEIVEVVRADPKVIDAYAHSKDYKGKEGGMKPLGKLRLKHIDNPDPSNEDCSEDGMDEPINYNAVEEFWLEDSILEHCIVGVKMLAKVWELNTGAKYFDQISGICCSFYTVLPQERMQGWREPELNQRGPPTVDNPTGVLLQEDDEDDEDGPRDEL